MRQEWGWGDSLSSAPHRLQVGQYVSRAEELKAIVSSSNQALLRQGTSAQDLLRGRPGSWPQPLPFTSSRRGGSVGEAP